MIHLVLDHPGLEPGGLDHDPLPIRVKRPDPHVNRALNVDVHTREAEAALLHLVGLLARPFDLGVDQHGHRRLLLDPVDQQAVKDPDLGRGQPDSQSVAHQRAHLADLVS